MQGSVLRAIGQEAAANLVGTTTDTKGTAVPFARVSITNDNTGLERQTTSDKEGNFVLPALSARDLYVNSAKHELSQNASGRPPIAGRRQFQSRSPISGCRNSARECQGFQDAGADCQSAGFHSRTESQTITDEYRPLRTSWSSPGEVGVYITTVGYGLLKTTPQVPADIDTDVDLQIGQEALKRNDQVTVSAGPYDRIDPKHPPSRCCKLRAEKTCPVCLEIRLFHS